jgi:hypothetical protein
MAELKISIGGEALKRLMQLAVAERRPADFQAEVLVLRGLGCWPYDTPSARDGLLRALDGSPETTLVEASGNAL